MVSKGPDVLLDAFAKLSPGRATLELFGAPADYHGETRLSRAARAAAVDARRDRQRSASARADSCRAGVDRRPGGAVDLAREQPVRHSGSAAQRHPGDRLAHWRHPRADRRRPQRPAVRAGGRRRAATARSQRLLDEPGLLDDAAPRAPAPRRSARSTTTCAPRMRSTSSSRPGRPWSAGDVPREPPARRIAAVVVNHRTPTDTRLAVRSLLASRRPVQQVIVVDNDGPDELRGAAAAWGPAVTYLHTGANLGFAGGMNAGVRAALDGGADAVLLVNSDAVVAPSCLDATSSARSTRAGRTRRSCAPLLLARTTRPPSPRRASTTTAAPAACASVMPDAGAMRWTCRPGTASPPAAASCW